MITIDKQQFSDIGRYMLSHMQLYELSYVDMKILLFDKYYFSFIRTTSTSTVRAQILLFKLDSCSIIF